MRQTSESYTKELSGRRLQLRVGDGGWVRALVGPETAATPAATDAFFLRFDEAGGSLFVAEVVHEPLGGRPVDPDLLRVVIGTIDRRINAPAIADELRARLGRPGPDVRRAVEAFEGLSSVAVGDGPLDHSWKAEMLLAAMAESAVPNMRYKEPTFVPGPKPADLLEEAMQKAVLTVPDGKPYPESFYVAVADAYRAIAPWTHKPAVVIADANPPHAETQVRGWIATARRRGHLAPGRRGKVG